ncbi:MAG: AAA family ATPase [Deltaproteobacteria bacterium]|nr:AAA family ATPase [Deltaproteobacteria bacterium]
MTILNKDKILETAKDFVTQGKFDKAIREYEKILDADPKDMRVKLRIAELFTKRRQIPEAIKAYCFVAEHYATEGFYLKAVTIYKSILRLNPSMLDVNQSLAHLYEKMGLNPDAVHQYEILASSYEQKRQFDEALKVRQKLVELAPQDAGHRIRLAEGYQREERKDDAIEQYEILAVQYREQKKEPQHLIDLYERILPSRPQNKDMLFDLVHLYHAKKDFKSALKWLEQGKQAVSGNADLLSLQAEMYAALHQLDTARGKFQELAELHVKSGEKEKALLAYCEIIVLLPEETETLRPLVEVVEPGAMEKLIREAGVKREAKAEQTRLEEEAIEKEKEARELARHKPEGASHMAAPVKVETKVETKPPVLKQAAVMTSRFQVKVETTKIPETNDIPALLGKAQSAITLAKAYLSMGLDNEAQQEWKQAEEALHQVLAADDSHILAKKLLQELPGTPSVAKAHLPSPTPPPPAPSPPPASASPSPPPPPSASVSVSTPLPAPIPVSAPIQSAPEGMPQEGYLHFYFLKQEPFSIVPLTHFYFGSEQHDRAMERLIYAVQGMKGLALVIGGVGLGKTLLEKRLLESLPKSEYEAAMMVVLHEDVDATWLLKRIAALLGVEQIPEKKIDIVTHLLHRLNDLARQGRKAIILIDEAHMLRGQALMEEIRGLLNLELESQKLLTFVLFGLPELEKNMNVDPALAQRVAVRFNLKPLPEEVVAKYIDFRLKQAGATDSVFSEEAIEKILEYSHRIPRLINIVCDNALFEGYLRRSHLPLGVDIVTSVAEDLGLAKH